jgi:general secretion pathway protein L
MARIIGIDLGAYAVKIAVFQGAFGRFEIEEYLSTNVPRDGDAPGGLPAQLECMQQLMAGLPTDDRIAVGAAFPTEQASVRLVSLPFADKNQIKQTLGFEVEGQVPFDLEDMVLTHRVLDSSAEGSQVLAALTPRDRLRALVAAFDESEADPKSMVIDGDVLGEYGTSGVEAVVDIGHRRTIATICQNGRVWSTRAISMGGQQLTAALVDAHRISWQEAQSRKHGASLRRPIVPATPTVAEWEEDIVTQTAVDGEAPPVHPPGATQDGEILRKALEPLLSKLRTTLINFEDTTGLDIRRVLLAGGTANLGGLQRLLSVELGVEVRRLSVSDIAHAAGQPSRFALAHALALRTAGMSSGEEMELRTGEFKFRGDLANLRTVAKWGSVAIAALFLMGIGVFSWKVVDYNNQLTAIDTTIAEVVLGVYGDELTADDITGPEDALTKIQLRTVETLTRIEALGSMVADSPPIVEALHDLSTAMPKPTDARIDVRELTATPNSINIQAETDSYDAAATIEKSVTEHERFSGAKKSDEKKVRDGIRFSLTVPLTNGETADTEEG